MASANSTATAFRSLKNAYTQIRPFLPLSTHLILSALFPIYTGSHASLVRPSSAASPPTRTKRKRRHGGSPNSTDDSESDSEDDEEDREDSSLAGKMEGLSPSDALLFPLLAGTTLAGLYVVIKWLGAEMLNKVLGWYFSCMACFSVGTMLNDGVAVLGSVVWPNYYAAGGKLWKVMQKERRVVVVGRARGTDDRRERHNPLPGLLGSVDLNDGLSSMLWELRGALSTRYAVRIRAGPLLNLNAKLTLRTLVSSLAAVGIVAYATFVSTPWYLTNLQGFAFSYTALQLLSPTTFGTGSLVLAALFFYDIYFVFYTPLMVTVATNLDVPIKLLFPRPAEEEGKPPSLAMLGLGDVVLPGIMIGLCLRFDLYLHYLRLERRQGNEVARKADYVSVTSKWGDRLWTSGWNSKVPLALPAKQDGGADVRDKTIESVIPSFQKTYFHASVVGYVLGMTTTLGIMHVFKHAQPALLYLVPGVLGSIWATAWWRKDVKLLWDYTEMTEEEESEERDKRDGAKEKQTDDAKKQEAGKDGERKESGWLERFFGDSFFGTKKNERNAKKLEKSMSRTFTADKTDKGEGDKVQKRALFHFSIKRVTKHTKRPKASQRDAVAVQQEDQMVSAAPTGADIDSSKDASLSSSGSEADDVVLIHKADAASFIDTRSNAGARGKSSGVDVGRR